MERNRINSAKHYKKLRALSKIGAGLPHWNVDILRRVLVEVPPELGTENERLAYFRGFMAGTKRNAEETARFERLKDLPHRIASERASLRGIGYEEAISAAYEGLLVFLRSKEVRTYENLEHERACAAKKIRWCIQDYKKVEGPLKYSGFQRWIGGADPTDSEGVSFLSELATAKPDEDGADLWAAVEDRLREREDGGERLLEILRAKLDGLPLKEIGKRWGLTESRVCQILKEERPWLEENVGPLLGREPADTSAA